MAYLLRNGRLSRVDLNKYQNVTDDTGGPAYDSGGGSQDPVAGQDPANLGRRPPLAPPASGFDFDRVHEIMTDDANTPIYTGEVGGGESP